MYKGEKVLDECTVEEIISLLTYVNTEEKDEKQDDEYVQGAFAVVELQNKKKGKPSALELEENWKNKIIKFFGDHHLDGKTFVESSIKRICQDCMNALIPPTELNEKGKPKNTKLRGGVNQILKTLRALKGCYVSEILKDKSSPNWSCIPIYNKTDWKIKRTMAITTGEFRKQIQYCNWGENDLDSSILKRLHEIANKSERNINIEVIIKCFKENNINYEWFKNHKRNDLIQLLGKSDIRRGVSSKIWNVFSNNNKWIPLSGQSGVQIVCIDGVVDIGILCQFDKIINKYKPISIHLDGEYLKKYHHISPETNEYNCLDNLSSNITHLIIKNHIDNVQDIIEYGVMSFVNEWNNNSRAKYADLENILQCFREHDVMNEYIGKGRRKDLMFMLKHKYKVPKAISSGLWIFFTNK
eukprot:274495_1